MEKINYKELADKFCEYYYTIAEKNRAVRWQHFEEAAQLRSRETVLAKELKEYYDGWVADNRPNHKEKDAKDEEIERLTEAIRKLHKQIDDIQKEAPSNWVSMLKE